MKLIKVDDPVLYLAIVHWMDATGNDDTWSPEQKYVFMTNGGVRSIATGFVKESNEKGVTIYTELFEDLDSRRHLTIPVGMVLTSEFFKVGKKKELFNGRA